MWAKISAQHEDIDAIIMQIDLITQLSEDEIFEDIRNNIERIGQKKFFLDSL